MIVLYCEKCGAELSEPGALVLSPPQSVGRYPDSERDLCDGFHVCVNCWPSLKQWLDKKTEGGDW